MDACVHSVHNYPWEVCRFCVCHVRHRLFQCSSTCHDASNTSNQPFSDKGLMQQGVERTIPPASLVAFLCEPARLGCFVFAGGAGPRQGAGGIFLANFGRFKLSLRPARTQFSGYCSIPATLPFALLIVVREYLRRLVLFHTDHLVAPCIFMSPSVASAACRLSRWLDRHTLSATLFLL